MAKTNIEWTATKLEDGTIIPGYTFNPWIGCTPISSGCINCYAERDNKRYKWVEKWGKGKPRRRTSVANWNKVLQWNNKAAKENIRYKVFCASLADVFDAEVISAWRKDLGELILATPNLDWLILTKRPENILRMADDLQWRNPDYNCWQIPDNVWLGITAEDEENYDKRIDILLSIPARVRWLSIEPMLSPINLALFGTIPKDIMPRYTLMYDAIHWVICGGESGKDARPMDLAWARNLRDQCQNADTPFFFKQIDKKLPIPDDLMIREFPDV